MFMQLTGKDICFKYKPKSPWILNDVSISIESGERVGVVGPSGYGKSTLARILAGYEKPITGEVKLDGEDLPQKGYCPVQIVYQHPELSVNPRLKMGDILQEAWIPDDELLSRMGIEKKWFTRWPTELSGGELQRFCIARVLSPKTKFLICDEITTMLDAITQAQIWNLLLDEGEKRNLGMMIITHNKSLAERVCTRIIELPKLNHVERADV